MAGLHHCHGACVWYNEDASTLSVYRGGFMCIITSVFKEVESLIKGLCLELLFLNDTEY